MRCDDAAEHLAASDGVVVADAGARQHVEQCLRCQADLVHHRRLLRALRSLRADVIDPGPELLAAVLAALDRAGASTPGRSLRPGRRVAYLGGIAAATAAGAAGALVISTRSRRGRVRLAG